MGQFPVYDIRDGTLIRYYGCSEHVAIPEGVTKIGEGAFNNYRGRKYVQRVTIPEGVTSIGEGVFYKCSAWWCLVLLMNDEHVHVLFTVPGTNGQVIT